METTLGPDDIRTLHGGGYPFATSVSATVRALPLSPEDDPLQRLPRSVPISRESQQRIVDQLRTSGDMIWKMDKFEEEWKFNCLRITPAGQVFLDVMKPGVHFSRMVQLVLHTFPTTIKAVRDELMRDSSKVLWEKSHAEGFLPKWTLQYNEGVQLDQAWSTRPGAAFVFNRALDLNIISGAQRAIFRWKWKHTNPLKEGEAFKVEDSLGFEWESLPE